jgi:hypothetical protein
MVCPSCGAAVNSRLIDIARGSASGLTFYSYRCLAGHLVRRISRLQPVA